MVVPHPQNGSSTTSPALVLALIILSSSANGFWVGNPRRSCAWEFRGAISIQTSSKGFPSRSSKYLLTRGTAPGLGWITSPALYAAPIRSLVHRQTLSGPTNSYV